MAGVRAHGGPRPGELEGCGLTADDILDFSVNINPYGPCPEVAAAIRAAPLDRYPDPEARAARGALAALWDVPLDELALGNGATELLWLLARLLLRADDVLVVAAPTFSEMATAAKVAGAQVVEVRGLREDDFGLRQAALSEAVARFDARAVYLCAPNNPTGGGWAMERIRDLAALHPGVTFVIDQAFLSLSEDHAELAAGRPPNAALVRSLTKDHALPGLRLGAVLADAALIEKLEGERPTWHTGTLVQAAATAIASPAAQQFVARSRAIMLADRRRLQSSFRERGYRVLPSRTTFVLVEVADAAATRERLWGDHQVLVRDCTSFGLPTFIRVGARPAVAQDALFKAGWARPAEGGG